ncbi:hypothetical protein OIN60_01525 [Paenibacillus sp. P96]|uniref:DUF3168 domain-containing protein n=1 Tax=Paenibacillus zeirhizosphaerae TaxID=2987519 RepID=A0ABT9FM63_9BACL|nr:hypothetical protein [Paenibacillus sp. P96]MDP4095472.1 hypothetical protein [Paenibacillus sp. P96]
MTNMYALIYDTLLQLGYPVREQGTYAEGEVLPETFVTYQVIDTPDVSHADNLPTAWTVRIQVALYSKKPAIKQGAEAAIRDVMLPADFMRIGGRDLPYSQATGHYAYTCDYRYYDQA